MATMDKQTKDRDSVADAYHENGYFSPIRVLPADEALTYRRKLEAYEGSTGGPLKREFRQKAHLLFTWLADLVRDPRILDVVEPIIGPDILVWQSVFFIKEPHDPAFVSWHQDSTYWGLSEPEVVTAWVAFSPSTPLSGCVRVVPGTHRFDQVPHKETRDRQNLLTRGQEIAVEVNEADVVGMPLDPGEMSLHHIRTFHNSEPNRSDDRRIGFAIRYIPARVRQLEVQNDTATLARGEDKYGHFELEPRPTADLAPEAVAYHADIMRRRAGIYGKSD